MKILKSVTAIVFATLVFALGSCSQDDSFDEVEQNIAIGLDPEDKGEPD